MFKLMDKNILINIFGPMIKDAVWVIWQHRDIVLPYALHIAIIDCKQYNLTPSNAAICTRQSHLEKMAS